MIPALTEDQRAHARDTAVVARRARAALKDSVRSGERTLIDAIVMARSDAVLAHIRVVDLLQCVRGVGPQRAARIVARLGISASRRLRGLGTAQIERLRQEFS